jgi:hypothetical protein
MPVVAVAVAAVMEAAEAVACIRAAECTMAAAWEDITTTAAAWAWDTITIIIIIITTTTSDEARRRVI